MLDAPELVGELRELGPVLLELALPRLAPRAPASPDAGREVLAHPVGHQELRVLRPAIRSLGETDLLRSQRLPVRRAGVLLVRRAVADVAVDDEERRPVVRALERRECALEHVEVVGIADADDVPAVREEAARDVVAERQLRVAFDRDVVVVVDPAQVRDAQVAGERRASLEMPSIMQPSPQSAYTSKSNRGKPGRLKCCAIQRPATAMPTLMATPWPSGPVVHSMPDVQRYSGCPGQRLSSWRKCFRSSSETDGRPRIS